MSHAVRAEHLVLRHGDVVAVDRSTFTIPRGQVTAIIGPNGSGKSTLLHAIAGLMEPVAGQLEVEASSGGSERVSYVLQTTRVNDSLPVSVREVVAMGRYAGLGAYRWLAEADRRAVDEAMERTGISALASRHLTELSGGQRQRVFVAQGLAQDHDLLLLDEPLTGIDLAAARAIDEAIHDEVGRGCTVILTTHDLSEAQVADYVVLLSGRVVAAGPPDQVLTAEHLTEAYGSSLLHVSDGRVFVDDAAHQPAHERHVHRERTVHVEATQAELHGD